MAPGARRTLSILGFRNRPEERRALIKSLPTPACRADPSPIKGLQSSITTSRFSSSDPVDNADFNRFIRSEEWQGLGALLHWRSAFCGVLGNGYNWPHGWIDHPAVERGFATPHRGAGRARWAQAGDGRVGLVQQGRSQPVHGLCDPDHRAGPCARASEPDQFSVVRPPRRRVLLLGSADAAAARCRREGAAPPRGALRHPHRLQSELGGLPYLLAVIRRSAQASRRTANRGKLIPLEESY